MWSPEAGLTLPNHTPPPQNWAFFLFSPELQTLEWGLSPTFLRLNLQAPKRGPSCSVDFLSKLLVSESLLPMHSPVPWLDRPGTQWWVSVKANPFVHKNIKNYISYCMGIKTNILIYTTVKHLPKSWFFFFRFLKKWKYFFLVGPSTFFFMGPGTVPFDKVQLLWPGQSEFSVAGPGQRWERSSG